MNPTIDNCNKTTVNKNRCQQCVDRSMTLCFVVNGGLFLFKAILGILGGSFGLLADSFYSLAGVLNAAVSIIAHSIEKKTSSSSHPYGYGKIEYLTGTFIGIFLLIGTIYFFISSFEHLIGELCPHYPNIVALLGAVLSAIALELLYRYTICTVNKANSSLMKIEAATIRSDEFSSVVVGIGILFSLLGYNFFDSLAAFIVSLMIGKVAIDLIIGNVNGLMDASLHPEEVKKIKLIVSSNKGVLGIDSIKTRGIGRNLWVDIQIFVKETLSLEESHVIAEEIRQNLFKKIKNLKEAAVACKGK